MTATLEVYRAPPPTIPLSGDLQRTLDVLGYETGAIGLIKKGQHGLYSIIDALRTTSMKSLNEGRISAMVISHELDLILCDYQWTEFTHSASHQDLVALRQQTNEILEDLGFRTGTIHSLNSLTLENFCNQLMELYMGYQGDKGVLFVHGKPGSHLACIYKKEP